MARARKTAFMLLLGTTALTGSISPPPPPPPPLSFLSAVTYDRSFGDGTVDASGFANLPLAGVNARYIYVSSATGNNANTGLSHAQAVATLAKAATLKTDGHGDQVLVAEGTTYAEGPPDLLNGVGPGGFGIGGFSAQYPYVCQSYDPTDPTNTAKFGRANGTGSHARPVMLTYNLFGSAGHLGNIVFRGIDFSPTNTSAQGNTAVDCGGNWLFENCIMRYSSLTIKGLFTTLPIRNVVVRNCSIYGGFVSDSDQSNIYLSTIAGLVVEDCVLYHGWQMGVSRDDIHNGANTLSHIIYQQHSVKGVVRRNFIVDGAADGGSHRDDNLVQGNFYLDNPVLVGFGGGNGYDKSRYKNTFGITCDFTYNVALGGADITSTQLRGWGLTAANGNSLSKARYNVLAHNTGNGGTGNFSLGFNSTDNSPSIMLFDHNKVFGWAPSGGTKGSGGPIPAQDFGTWTNNVWDDPSSGSNVVNSSVVVPNSSFTVADVISTLVFADKTTMMNYAIANPEQRIHRTAYLAAMAAYGVTVPAQIDLAMDSTFRNHFDCGIITNVQDGSTLTYSGFPASVTIDSDKRMWFCDGTAVASASGTGTITETRSDASARTTSVPWVVKIVPSITAVSITNGAAGAGAATLNATIDQAGTFYWAAWTADTSPLYAGEVFGATTFNYAAAAASGTSHAAAPGSYAIPMTGFTPGTQVFVGVMAVADSDGEWSRPIDGSHCTSGLAVTPPAGGWTPASLPGLVLWVEADPTKLYTDAGTTLVSTDGQSVQQANDKSGNGNNLSQATAGQRPVYKTGAGKPYLQFTSASSQILDSASTITSADGSGQNWVGVSLYVNSVAASQGVMECQSGVFVFPSSAEATYKASNGNADFGPAVTAATPCTIIGSLSTTIIESFLNNTTDGSSAAGAGLATAAATFHLGHHATDYLDGRIYGIVYGTGTLSPADRASLHTYLAALHP